MRKPLYLELIIEYIKQFEGVHRREWFTDWWLENGVILPFEVWAHNDGMMTITLIFFFMPQIQNLRTLGNICAFGYPMDMLSTWKDLQAQDDLSPIWMKCIWRDPQEWKGHLDGEKGRPLRRGFIKSGRNLLAGRKAFPQVWRESHLEVMGDKGQGQKKKMGLGVLAWGLSCEGSRGQVIEWV
jgi:hypothetical protein